MTRLTRTVVAMSVALAIGCLSPVDPDATPVAEVRVSFAGGAAVDTIQLRDTTRVLAAAIASQGYDLGRRDFSYESSDTTIARVDGNGVVRGMRAGTATIRASLPSGMFGEATIVVVHSTVAYTIDVGPSPSALGFSPDYTRLYVVMGSDSLGIVDALGYFRIGAIGLGLPAGAVAVTSSAIHVTHPAHDSITVISPATGAVIARRFVGAGPIAAVADVSRAYVATRYDRRIVILDEGAAPIGLPVGGEPVALAVSRDGRRLFAGVATGSSWRLVIAAPAYPDTLESLALATEPIAIATDASGARAYVLLATGRILALAEGADGRYIVVATADAPAGATSLSATLVGPPVVVVSGEPVMVLDGTTLEEIDRAPAAGRGVVAVRPDGVFAFIADLAGRVLRVVTL